MAWPQAPKERDTHSAVVLGGQMVVFGGDRGGEYLADVWSYSIAEDAWTRLQARHSCFRASLVLIVNVLHTHATARHMNLLTMVVVHGA